LNRSYFYAAAGLLAAALLLGGGGTTAPLQSLLIQLVAIGVLALLAIGGVRLPAVRAGFAAIILLILIIVTPLLQLVPLPHAIWSNLPGRELAAQIDGLLGDRVRWRALSLDPEATLLSALWLLAPTAMFLVTLQLDQRDRVRLLMVTAGCAIVSLSLGLLQVAGQSEILQPYGGSHSGWPTGLFVNRNHQADFLLTALVLGVAVVAPSRHLSIAARWGLSLAIVAAFSAGVIATTSRMGLILLPVALLGALSMLAMTELMRARTAVLAAGACAGALAILVGLSDGMWRTLQRFDATADTRAQFWSDGLFAARQYLPWGSGVGTFDPVYRAVEDLDQVGPAYANLAHNDYLQILIETGIWGAGLVLAFLALFAWLALRPVDRASAVVRRAASVSILILLIHSAVDYPLRMLSLLTLFGFLFALLFAARSDGAKVSVGMPPS